MRHPARTFFELCALSIAANVWAAGPPVIFNEISYNPPGSLGSDEDHELVELLNRSAAPVDVGGWTFKDEADEHGFALPAGTRILPGEYLVIARNPAAVRTAYGADLAVVGPFDFALDNGGGTVRLLDSSGVLIDEVEYDDDPPWPVEADGGGSTLERVDPSLEADDFSSFQASLPSDPPGTPGSRSSRFGALPAKHGIVIDEISYNPVRDEGADPLRHCESQEHLELFNRSADPIDLSGWSFAAGIAYTFPRGTVLPAGGYLALYKDEAEFKARYPDPEIRAEGPFDGSLDNGGEGLLLVDAGGEPVDFVKWNDAVPWPVNPDGTRGTLELADPFSDNERARSWEESADSKGTPGAINSATEAFLARGGNGLPDITLVEAKPEGDSSRGYPSSDDVRVTAKIAGTDGLAGAWVDYQAMPGGSYIRRSDSEFLTTWTTLDMALDPASGLYGARIPRQPHRTLVRYRVRAKDGSPAHVEAQAPRANDPEPNFAYFVYDGVPDYTANVQSDFGPAGFVHAGLEKLPVYHMIASAEDIHDALYVVRDWQDDSYRWRVTIVFYRVDPVSGAVETRVHDHVQMRLKGGVHRYHWPKRGWKLKFNHGNYFSGRFNDGAPYPRKRSHLHLTSTQHNNGRPRGESGVFESLAWKLFRDARVTASSTTFVQVRVVDAAEELDQYAGDFFGIFLDIERVDATLLENLGLPSGDAAGIYKIDGSPEEIHPDCSASTADADAFIRGYTSINTADWYRETFDLEKYFSFRSVVEFAHHYDMGAKNYYYYHNTATGLWEMVPWDLDNTFGSDSGDGSEPFYTRVLPKFPAQFKSRMRFLNQTLFTQERMERQIDAWRPLVREVADADMDRWNRGPDCLASVPGNSGSQCGYYLPFERRMTDLKNWIRTRRGIVEPMFRDAAIPATPVNQRPLDGSKPGLPLRLEASPYTDPDGDAHARSHWLVVEAGGDWAAPIWEEVSDTALTSISPSTKPGEEPFLVFGRAYEFRVRYADAAGRWSFLSAPTRFAVGTPDPTPPTPPSGLRVISISARAATLEWVASSDPESGILGYRVLRDGKRLDAGIRNLLRFTDLAPVPRRRHSYAVVAVSVAGLDSEPSSSVEAEIPGGNFGGWSSPDGGFDYFFDAAPGQDLYNPDKLARGCLDGTWSRSAQTDNWSGSKPGHGPPPGGVEAVEAPGVGEDGAPASVLSIEDPGNPTGEGIPPDNNRRILLLRELGGPNPFSDGPGLTLVARFRVHPSPVDAPSTGQEPSSMKGQIGVARYEVASGDRRHFSFALSQDTLLLPGAMLPARMHEMQSLWITITKESSNAGDDIYRVRAYRDGSAEPALDQALSLSLTGTENVSSSAPVTYLELGLTDTAGSGAIQVDFIGYKLGAFLPVPAGAQGRFLRGDADSSGRLGISDAIFTLRHLFQGGPGSSCPDSEDADDSGSIELDDAVLTLHFLFQGGSRPPPPTGVCGEDPSADALPDCALGGCS